MAGTQRVRNASIYLDSKKVATMQNVSYTFNTNDTQEVADGGVYVADGVALSEVTSNNIIPVAGTGTGVFTKALQKAELTIQLFPVDGKAHVLKKSRVRNIQIDSESASGRQTGSFSFFAGQPEIIG